MTSSNIIADLAPSNLRNNRPDRYNGAGFSCRMTDFAPEDASLLLGTYRRIKQIYDLWLYNRGSTDYAQIKVYLMDSIGDNVFFSNVQSIGDSTRSLTDKHSIVRRVIHDVRGGALVPLMGYAQMLKEGLIDTVDIKMLVFLARDHAKMMRNAIEDIDTYTRNIDEAASLHTIDDLREKWLNLDIKMGERHIDIDLDCRFDGSISNCCLEVSATDRIIYNYVNNAARFAADERVGLHIVPCGEELVRIATSNVISPDHAAWLQEHTGGDLNQLFKAGVTRGSSGLGLSNCADFVTTCFGLKDSQQALEQGYLGARLDDHTVYFWFHWPRYVPTEEDTPCNCEDH